MKGRQMSPVFVKVARVSEVHERRSKLVHLEEDQIALWRINGRIYAINNSCPHQHIGAIHLGSLDGLCVTCPMHGWTFSLETGASTFGEGRARTYRTRIEGDDVLVEKPAGMW